MYTRNCAVAIASASFTLRILRGYPEDHPRIHGFGAKNDKLNPTTLFLKSLFGLLPCV